MRILLYEFVTGGGWFSVDPIARPQGSLLAEGRAMLEAALADFASLSGVTVDVLHDVRLMDFTCTGAMLHPVDSAAAESRLIRELAAGCDWTLLIAPEFDDHLLHRAQAVHEAGGRLLSPDPDWIRLTAGKHATAERLRRFGVPAPVGRLLGPDETFPQDFPYPAILKPELGCGSLDVHLVKHAADRPTLDRPWPALRLERYCRGTPHSMAVLCGPMHTLPLQLFEQRLSSDGRFGYLGGAFRYRENLERRARSLVLRSLKAFPPVVGYVGFDLVLGSREDGGEDFVIEINPRLTTSYIGQRHLYRQTLARMMLDLAEGRWPASHCNTALRVSFDAQGKVTHS